MSGWTGCTCPVTALWSPLRWWFIPQVLRQRNGQHHGAPAFSLAGLWPVIRMIHLKPLGAREQGGAPNTRC